MAVLCEKVLQEQDGVLSVIRVVDRIIQTAIGPEAPEEMPPVPINLTVVVVLKSGSALGRNNVRITLDGPSGLPVGPEISLPVHFEGDERGSNLVLNLGFQAEDEGLYWFNVELEPQGVLLTRIPLRVIYQPQRLGTGATG